MFSDIFESLSMFDQYFYYNIIINSKNCTNYFGKNNLFLEWKCAKKIKLFLEWKCVKKTFLLGLKICIVIEIVLSMVIGLIYAFLNYEILHINLLFIIKIVYIPVYAHLFFYNEYLWQFYLNKYAINLITDRAIFVYIDFALRVEIKYGDTIISMSPTFQGIGKK